MIDFAIFGLPWLLLAGWFFWLGGKQELRRAMDEFWDTFQGGSGPTPPSFPLPSADSAILNRPRSAAGRRSPPPN